METVQIYSGPSGKFRPHVDTPRSPRQFGSLVVCLPHPHRGGQLRVSHKGVESSWDWSNDGTDKIEWAAFYSDCEHEVLEVQTGHRVTLTYNLYVYEQVGKVIRKPPTADPESYPLYTEVKEILTRPEFLKDGKLPQLLFKQSQSDTYMQNQVAPWASIVLTCTHTATTTMQNASPLRSRGST